MKKIAVFPGSFDPITIGHVDVLMRSRSLFDEIYVAIGVNSQKSILYPLEKRLEWIEKICKPYTNIHVVHFTGLTAHFCKSIGAQYLLRGVRNSTDYEYEKTISQINQTLVEGLETVFIIARPELSHISSTIVRELILGKADLSPFVPALILNELKTYK